MKNPQQSFTLLLFIFFFACVISGCENNTSLTEYSPEKNEQSISDKDVTLQDATTIALKLNAESHARISSDSSEIIETQVISDSSDNRPLLYIIKKRKGFAIVSGDFHTMPVLAFSDNSNIDLNDIPEGVKLWMESAKYKVRDARRDTSEPHPIVAGEWRKYLANRLKVTDSNCIEWYQYGQFQCKGTFFTKGPLLTTLWGQKRLSTTQLSTAGDCDSCGRRLAGCGPVAMAQLEEYYHPDPARPRNSAISCTATNAGEKSIGVLMQKMGAKANASYNYMGSCNTFTWPNDVKSGLKSFGFSRGGSGSEAYNYSLIKSELNGNHPLIFWGSTCLTCFENYHIWVCDGYQENNYSEFDCATKQCKYWSYSYLHMNWGWKGDWNDFYAYGAYTPMQQNYNANLHVISNIRP